MAVLGLFNSKVANWWFVKRYGVLMEVGGFKVLKIPLPPAWRREWARLAKLVEAILQLLGKRRAARGEHEKTVIQRQTQSIDHEIDLLLNRMYGLTPAETDLMEGTVPSEPVQRSGGG